MALFKLPYELIFYVVQHLDLADIWSLSLSCKSFLFLIYEPSIAKQLLEVRHSSRLPYY